VAARLVSPVVKLGKQKIITGEIVDVLGALCSVRLSGKGATLHSVKFTGPTPAVGDAVLVDYRSGTPVVHTNAENLENALEEVEARVTAVAATANNTPPPPPESIPTDTYVRQVIDGASAPTVSDDDTQGYSVTDVWIGPTGEVYMCVDNTTGVAVWVRIGGANAKKMITFATEGTLITSTGAIRMYNNFGQTFTITKVHIAVATAPTGSSIIVDINKNGTTIFTNQAHRPSIAVSGFTGSTTTIDVSSFADGDYLTFDIDQKGSTIAGANLTVQVYFQ